MALSERIVGLESAVNDLVTDAHVTHDAKFSPELRAAYQSLIEASVADEIASRLVRRVRTEISDHQAHDPVEIRKRLAAHIEATLPIAPPVTLNAKTGPTVISLVGPTGVGKTTTIAKLAAQYRLKQGRSVGLITIDTYRIAAVDQLRTYARIIDVPLEVATTPDQLRAAVNALRQCDVILIDTAGRGQNDQEKLNQLADLIEVASPDEVHLVLAATSSAGVLHQAVQRFSHLGVNRMILTKLDEAVGFGVTLDVLQRAEAQLSYVTTGQEVPDDIEEGRGARLADLIVAGRDAHPAWRTTETTAKDR